MNIKKFILGTSIVAVTIICSAEGIKYLQNPEAYMIHREYKRWKMKGSSTYKPEFYQELVWDRKRQRAIRGLTLDQILEKYPHLISSTELKEGSYKRDYFERVKWDYKDVEVYWMNDEDQWAGWCIEVKGTNSPSIRLIKG